MKRIITAGILLVLILGMNFLSNYRVKSICNESVKGLNNCLEYIENGKSDRALSELKDLPDISALSPYIYKEDINEYESSLLEAEGFLKNDMQKDCRVKINECIFMLKRIKKNQNLFFENFI